MIKSINALGLKDHNREVITNMKSDKIKVWHNLSIKKDGDCWAIKFMDMCSDKRICFYANVDVETYRKKLANKYDVFVQGDCTFFRKRPEAKKALEWIDSLILLDNMKN